MKQGKERKNTSLSDSKKQINFFFFEKKSTLFSDGAGSAPDFTARVGRDDCWRCAEPLTGDSCLPVLQTGCEASWDAAHSQVRTPEGSHHLVAVTERREGGATFLPPLSQGDGGHVEPGSLLAEQGLPITPLPPRTR